MSEEEKKVEGMTEDYLKVISDLKSNTVSKDDYNAMVEENRKLLQTIVNNEPRQEEIKPQEKIDIDALRNDLFNNEQTNLQYVEKALKLRKALIENGEEDPFVPQSSHYLATDEDRAAADKVAEGLAYCVEYAQGNTEVFTNELQRIMRDVRK